MLSPVKPLHQPPTAMTTPLAINNAPPNLHSLVPSGSRSSSSSSIPFAEGEVDVVTEEGLRHASSKLDARKYKSKTFAGELLAVLSALRIPSWSNVGVESHMLKIHKVSGSLTNAVFFVSCPPLPHIPTLLLRIYGPSSGSLISRPRELHTLHILSSKYRIGPRVFGTFENGRVEEYFESITLTASDLRDPQISRWIGARMAELHFVDIGLVQEISSTTGGEGTGSEIAAIANVKSWLTPAREVLALPTLSDSSRKFLDLDSFKDEWERYMKWVSRMERTNPVSRRVFSHNDTQYGNLLRLSKLKPGTPAHRQIVVVDFEYASPNPAAFDIANHFHEWTADYHSSTPHILDHHRYPTPEQRRNFYIAYLEHSTASPAQARFASLSQEIREFEIQKLDQQVRVWSPASHAMWLVWGIVQARSDLESSSGQPEFDYIGYARSRMEGFRREVRMLGI